MWNKKKPEYMNNVWSYDIITEHLENGRKAKLLNVIDEFTRESLIMDMGKRVIAKDVIDVFLGRGELAYIRSVNGPEFTTKKVKE